MKSKLITLAAFLCSFSLWSQELKTSVEEVTVYRNEGYVQREGKVDLSSGEQTLTLTGLPDNIDINSLRIKSRPSFQVLDIRPDRMTMEHDSLKKRSIKLEQQYKILVAEHKTLKTEREILKTEEQVLMNNTSYKGDQSGLTSAQLQQNMQYMGTTLRSLRKKMADQDEALEIKLAEANRVKGQINKLRSKRAMIQRVVRVKIDVDKSSTYTVSLNYLQPNSGWRPFYELKSGSLDEPIKLISKGMVQQQSGEDWEKVDLTLSTAEPRKGNSPPTFQPFNLVYGYPYQTNYQPGPSYVAPVLSNTVNGIVYDRHTGEAIPFANVIAYGQKGTMVASTTSSEDGSFKLEAKEGMTRMVVTYVGYHTMRYNIQPHSLYYEVQMSQNASTLEEIVIAEAESMDDVSYSAQNSVVSRDIQMMAGTNTSSSKTSTNFSQVIVNREPTNTKYVIATPQNVPSNGQEAGMIMRELSIPVHYNYIAYPEYDEKAFLFAYIPDWQKLDLLSGEAALYIQDQYLGKTNIDTKVMSDSLKISMGRDESISVRREAIELEQKKSLFGSNIKEERAFKITIKNTKNATVSMEVIDRIPVTQNPDIEIKAGELNGAKFNETNGKLTWKIDIPAGTTKTLEFHYTVKYPKDKVINLPR